MISNSDNAARYLAISHGGELEEDRRQQRTNGSFLTFDVHLTRPLACRITDKSERTRDDGASRATDDPELQNKRRYAVHAPLAQSTLGDRSRHRVHAMYAGLTLPPFLRETPPDGCSSVAATEETVCSRSGSQSLSIRAYPQSRPMLLTPSN